MKTISFLRNHFLVAIALLTAGVTMSFKMVEKEKVGTIFYYDSNSMIPGAFSNVANWTTSNPNQECVSIRDERPCKITVQENSTLSSLLTGKNNSQVLDLSEGFQPEP